MISIIFCGRGECGIMWRDLGSWSVGQSVGPAGPAGSSVWWEISCSKNCFGPSSALRRSLKEFLGAKSIYATSLIHWNQKMRYIRTLTRYIRGISDFGATESS